MDKTIKTATENAATASATITRQRAQATTIKSTLQNLRNKTHVTLPETVAPAADDVVSDEQLRVLQHIAQLTATP